LRNKGASVNITMLLRRSLLLPLDGVRESESLLLVHRAYTDSEVQRYAGSCCDGVIAFMRRVL
jgi:hypothetical protein